MPRAHRRERCTARVKDSNFPGCAIESIRTIDSRATTRRLAIRPTPVGRGVCLIARRDRWGRASTRAVIDTVSLVAFGDWRRTV